MSVDMRNSEGYLDLTAYEAIKKVEQEQRSGRAFRPIVYICSPYAGDIAGNVEAARRYSRFAVDKGYIPSHHICSIHSFWTMPTRTSVSLGYSLATPS